MYRKYCKRWLDVALAMLGLVVLAAPMAVVALVLRMLHGSGGVFFRQERPGLGGRIFKIWKFKTMTDACDQDGNPLADELRITPIGRFLRATSIDELPQLWNVIVGDMSIVGPRPLLPRYLPYYTEEEMKRHSVRPGITGLAQVMGRNHLGWTRRLEYDCRYVANLSFALDCKIVIRTIAGVLARKGVEVTPSSGFLDEERAPRGAEGA